MPPKVVGIERIVTRVPFRPHCAPYVSLDVPSLEFLEVIRLRTNASDVVGYGETPLRYTGRTVSDADVERAIGANPADLMFDDSLGIGRQMALLDAAGKANGIPIHGLLGHQERRSCPLAWWSSQATPPAALAAEAQRAVTEGYTTQKLKARPWWNVFSQVDQISAVTPPDHTLDVDWNDMLQVRGEAAAVLTELDRRPRIGIYESPLHRGDAEGLRALRQQVRRPLADHLTADSFRNSLLRDSLDGYVLFASGATGMVAQSRTCDEFDKSYFVQVLGAGLTTAYCLQLSAVMPGARWPMVTCLNIYSDDLLIEPIRIVGGQALVPDGPGLGVDVDEDALERLRVDPSSGPTMPRHIVTATLGSDRRRYTTIKALWNECRRPGRLPVQPDNAAMEIRVDDGSADFDRDYRSVGAQPVSTV